MCEVGAVSRTRYHIRIQGNRQAKELRIEVHTSESSRGIIDMLPQNNRVKLCCIACVILGSAIAVAFLAIGVIPASAAQKKGAAKPQTGKRETGASETVRMLRVPEGGIQPQAVVDAEGTLHLIYFQGNAGAGDVFYVRRANGESEFSRPLRVNSQSGSAIATGSIRGAQIALGKNGRVHVAWNGSGQAEPKGDPAKYKYNSPMLYSRLNDEGTAFEPQKNVVTEAYTLDGGGCVSADKEGNVYVVWHGNPGANGEGNRRVYMAKSTDEGKTFAPETPADTERLGVCGCCGLKSFVDSDGTLYVLYRSARENVNRDMHLLTSSNGGKSFKSQPADKWMIAQCPMSSESFVEAGDAVYGAWETNGQVYFAKIDKKTGKPGKPIAAPGAGEKRKHPSLAVNPAGQILLAWDEGTGWQKGGSLAWQVFDANGKPTKERGKRDGIPVWSFSAAVVESDGTFAVMY